MYYSIQWLNAANNHQPEVKTMTDEATLIEWGKSTLENFNPEMIRMSHEPTRHTSESQLDVVYWAEPVQGANPNVPSFAVLSQTAHYPATEACDDWFGTYEDADRIAYLLSQDIDIYA